MTQSLQHRIFTLFAALSFASFAEAQNCPPNTVCGNGSSCAPPICAGVLHTQVVSNTTTNSAPPQFNEVVTVPRFAAALGQVLTQVEVLVHTDTSGWIRVHNLSSGSVTTTTRLGANVAISAPVPALNGLVLRTATALFNDPLAPNNAPPCTYFSNDAAQHQHLDVADEKRICITDPVLLLNVFTATTGGNMVSFAFDSSETDQVPNGNICSDIINLTQTTVTVRYSFCGGASVGASFCAGDGTLATPCPCGNVGARDQGCANSINGGGAVMSGAGLTNPDTAVFNVQGLPATAIAIWLQSNGNNTNGALYGDGVRCTSGLVLRLFTKVAVNGTATAPGFTDGGVRWTSGQLGDFITNGSTRYYQVYYRDGNQSFCPTPTGNSWNVSNGLIVNW